MGLENRLAGAIFISLSLLIILLCQIRNQPMDAILSNSIILFLDKGSYYLSGMRQTRC